MGISISNIVSAVAYNSSGAVQKDNSKTNEKNALPAKENQGSPYANEKERKENEMMLAKMQMSETKLEALGDYFGAMQEALKDSGSNGMMAYRRTNNLISNANEYMSTSDYQEKENSKCLVKDMTDSMKENEEAIKEKADKKNKDKEKTEDSRETSDDKTASDMKPDVHNKAEDLDLAEPEKIKKEVSAGEEKQKANQAMPAGFLAGMIDISI